MKIPNLIKTHRLLLKESQKQFGKRFGSTSNTVSRWESGIYQAPYKVIEYILKKEIIEVICPFCLGKGMLEKLK